MMQARLKEIKDLKDGLLAKADQYNTIANKPPANNRQEQELWYHENYVTYLRLRNDAMRDALASVKAMGFKDATIESNIINLGKI